MCSKSFGQILITPFSGVTTDFAKSFRKNLDPAAPAARFCPSKQLSAEPCTNGTCLGVQSTSGLWITQPVLDSISGHPSHKA